MELWADSITRQKSSMLCWVVDGTVITGTISERSSGPGMPGTAKIRHRWYENNGIKSDWNSYLKSTIGNR